MIDFSSISVLGTPDKQEDSKYQVLLTDASNKSIGVSNYPRVNRFFSSNEDRDSFVYTLVGALNMNKKLLIYDPVCSHPCFSSFHIVDMITKQRTGFDITIYHN